MWRSQKGLFVKGWDCLVLVTEAQISFETSVNIYQLISQNNARILYILYTECPRRNVPDFGRVFLMLNYTDITQNTYVQSWTVTEIKAREKCGLLAVPRTVPGSRDVISIRCALSVLVYSRLKRVPRCDCTCKVLGNPKNNCDVSASVFVVQFNGFMSLTSYFDVKYRY